MDSIKTTIAATTTIAVLAVGAIVLNKDEIVLEPELVQLTKKQTTYFAEIDKDSKVLRVIVADQEFIDSGAVGDPASWVETSADGKVGKNYAGKNDVYDINLKAFIKGEPEIGKIFDEQKAQWVKDSLIIDTQSATSTI